MLKVRLKLALFVIVILASAFAIVQGCIPAGGIGEPTDGGVLEQLVSLFTRGNVRGGGGSGTTAVDAVQSFLGAAAEDAGRASFRCQLGQATSSSASTRRLGQIRIARSGFSYDAGEGASEEGVVPGAEVTVLGVADVSDVPEAEGEEVVEVDPTEVTDQEIEETTDDYVEEADVPTLRQGRIVVVADEEGDATLPPLPELPDEDAAYICEVQAPGNADVEPARIAVRPRRGRIVLVGTEPVEEPTPELYNITDYVATEANTRFIYKEYVSHEPWSLLVHEALDQDFSSVLPEVGGFSSFPFESWQGIDYFADVSSFWQWWGTGPEGLALYAQAPFNRPGETVPVTFFVAPVVFPNELPVGVLGTQELEMEWSALAYVEEVNVEEGLVARYQIQAAGEEISVPYGTFTDTLSVVWTIPFAEPTGDNSVAISPDFDVINVWTLAKNASGPIGILTAEQWVAAPNNPMLRELIYYAELLDIEEDFMPGEPSDVGAVPVHIE